MSGANPSIDGMSLRKEYPLYLAGRPHGTGAWLDVHDKYTGGAATRVGLASADDIDRAIAAAADSQPALRRMAAYERKAVLSHVARRLRERRAELAYVLCVEAGKPIKDSYGEIDRGIATFEIAAEESVRLYGEWEPLDIHAGGRGYTAVTRRFPIGPLSLISPFNFPVNLAAHKIAPAIAAGCPWVLKPASRTPVSALILAEILAETDLPPGSFSVLPCSRDGADLFTTDERLKLLSFTGSPAVGWDLKSRAGKKPVVLELGGNAAVVVDETVADLDDAVSRIVHGAYYQSGQSCISVQRIFVHSRVYDDFKPRLTAAVARLVCGDPKDAGVDVGPIISEKEAERIESWVTEGVKAGATLLAGGTRDGAIVQPTVLEGVPPGCKVRDEEVFGPVVCLERFDDFDRVVALINDSKFGLQAGLFSQRLDRVNRFFEDVECGGVVINDVPSKRIDSQPYGGVKDSGLGREGLRFAIRDFTEPRVMITLNAAGRRDE